MWACSEKEMPADFILVEDLVHFRVLQTYIRRGIGGGKKTNH
jgi:hypothetical protein